MHCQLLIYTRYYSGYAYSEGASEKQQTETFNKGHGNTIRIVNLIVEMKLVLDVDNKCYEVFKNKKSIYKKTLVPLSAKTTYRFACSFGMYM